MPHYRWNAESDGPLTPETVYAEVLRKMRENGCVCAVVIDLGPVVLDFISGVSYISPQVHHDQWCPFLRSVTEGPVQVGKR